MFETAKNPLRPRQWTMANMSIIQFSSVATSITSSSFLCDVFVTRYWCEFSTYPKPIPHHSDLPIFGTSIAENDYVSGVLTREQKCLIINKSS